MNLFKYVIVVILTARGYGKTKGIEINQLNILKRGYSTILDKSIVKLHFGDNRGSTVDQ